MACKNVNWVRTFFVTDPSKHEKGFTIYKVTSVIYPTLSPDVVTSQSVWKRFNDFKRLHSEIKNICKGLEITEPLPTFPKGKIFNRFEDDIIRERIKSALMLLEFIGRHSILFTSDVFIKFFETGYHVNMNQLSNSENISYNELVCSEQCTYDNEGNRDPDSTQDILSISSYSLSNDCTTDNSDARENFKTNTLQPVDLQLFDPLYDHKLNINRVNQNREDLMSFDVPCNVVENIVCHSEKPVKPTEVWVNVTAVSSQNDYLVEAAYHIGQGHTYEESQEFEAAFSFYKTAISCLLSGVKYDKDLTRRKGVRDKIIQYLHKSEQIYNKHLNKKQITKSVNELKVFKVLGIINKVMLVLNTDENKLYVIKVLIKSPWPIDSRKKTIIPKNVPYMVEFINYYESDCCYYIVLQYASGGGVWDHIDNYLQSVPVTPTRHTSKIYSCDDDYDEQFQQEVDISSTYGEKSYLDLIKNYTSRAAKHVFGYNEPDLTKDINSETNETVFKIPKSILRSESHVIFDNTLDIVQSLSKDNENEKMDSNSKSIGSKLVNIDMERLEDKEKSLHSDLVDLDVSDLVACSQKLLESVNKTLKMSEEVGLMNVVTTGTNSDRRTIEQESRETNEKELVLRRKRSSSHMSRSRTERRFSSDDVRCRTASSSLDRGAQWSRLVSMFDSPRKSLPEATIRVWAAELLVAIETLHRWGVICKDLHPGNILLGDGGHLLLSYQSYWFDVDHVMSERSINTGCASPETKLIFPITPAADWWSYGALLYQLLTGKTISECHPNGLHSHTLVDIPNFVSSEANSLLTHLLKHNYEERLGSGPNGSDDIKNHPFFNTIDWQSIYDVGVNYKY